MMLVFQQLIFKIRQHQKSSHFYLIILNFSPKLYEVWTLIKRNIWENFGNNIFIEHKFANLLI